MNDIIDAFRIATFLVLMCSLFVLDIAILWYVLRGVIWLRKKVDVWIDQHTEV